MPSNIIAYADNTGKFLVYHRESRGACKEFLIMQYNPGYLNPHSGTFCRQSQRQYIILKVLSEFLPPTIIPSVFRHHYHHHHHHHHHHHCWPFTTHSRDQSRMEVLCANWFWFCYWPLCCLSAHKQKWRLQIIIVVINLFSCHPNWRVKLYKVAVGAMPDTAKIRSRRVRCSTDICQITQILDMSKFVNRFVNTIGNYDKNCIHF
jgi:hypothetical protein